MGLLRPDVRYPLGMPVQVARTLGENLRICRGCSMAVEECTAGHIGQGCRGWRHWGTGRHVCPGHENDTTVRREHVAWPREH